MLGERDNGKAIMNNCSCKFKIIGSKITNDIY